MHDLIKGNIHWCDLPEYSDTVLKKRRPCLILSNDMANVRSTTVIVCPITHRIKKPELPCHVMIADGEMAKLEQILTIDKCKVGKYIKTLNWNKMREINQALLIELGII